MKKLMILISLALLILSCNTVPDGWGTVNAEMLKSGMIVAEMHMQNAPQNIRESSLAGALSLLQTKNDDISTDQWTQIGCKTALLYCKINFPNTDLVEDAKTFFSFPARMTDAEVLLTIVFAQWKQNEQISR